MQSYWQSVERLVDQGGSLIWVLGCLSIGAWTLIAWKWAQLRSHHGSFGEWTVRAAAHLRDGHATAALDLAREQADLLGRCFVSLSHDLASTAPPGSIGGPLDSGIARTAPDAAARRGRASAWSDALTATLTAEAERLREALPLIAALGAAAPLLGLLGTVFGMMDTFAGLSVHSGSSATAAGVAQALVTTQAGLVVALPILLAHRLLAVRIERLVDRASLGLSRLRAALAEG